MHTRNKTNDHREISIYSKVYNPLQWSFLPKGAEELEMAKHQLCKLLSTGGKVK